MPKPLIAKHETLYVHMLTWIRRDAMTVDCETQNRSPRQIEMDTVNAVIVGCETKKYVRTDIVNTLPTKSLALNQNRCLFEV